MKLLKNLLKKIFLFSSALQRVYESARTDFTVRYVLEEINIKENLVIIHCRHSRTYIKTTIDGAISTPGIIEDLSSPQACWLGYYHASSSTNKKSKKLNEQLNLGFTVQMRIGRFKIISLDHRTFILTYIDMQFNKTYKEHVTQVAQNQFVIDNIDPTQACYIGMQAGYTVAKQGVGILKAQNQRPLLKLVK